MSEYLTGDVFSDIDDSDNSLEEDDDYRNNSEPWMLWNFELWTVRLKL